MDILYACTCIWDAAQLVNTERLICCAHFAKWSEAEVVIFLPLKQVVIGATCIFINALHVQRAKELARGAVCTPGCVCQIAKHVIGKMNGTIITIRNAALG